MKRILSCLFVAGLIAIPAVASAEPQYVYVRYGDGAPHLIVSTTPLPTTVHAKPRLAYPYTRTWVERSDGMRFDSEVGARCGILSTDIFFGPTSHGLDANDRQTLTNFADCITRGPLAGRRINLVAGYDGSLESTNLAMWRLSRIIGQLQAVGVRSDQLTYSKQLTAGWQSDRVEFELADPMPWYY